MQTLPPHRFQSWRAIRRNPLHKHRYNIGQGGFISRPDVKVVLTPHKADFVNV